MVTEENTVELTCSPMKIVELVVGVVRLVEDLVDLVSVLVTSVEHEASNA